MAGSKQLLTLKEFHDRFDGEKPYFEFRRGEAIQKSMPTWLHSVLQRLMVEFLEKAGYVSGQEIELRVTDDWHPIPDVIAAQKIEDPYPTQAVDVVVEILSPDDRAADTHKKCADYEALGISAIFLLDPTNRSGWCWKSGNLDCIETLALPNGVQISLASVWDELDVKIKHNQQR